MNEFQFLNNLKSKYLLDRVGDDCAVLPKDANTDLLLTADMLVEDIDFRLTWTKPASLGHKALAVSLSDITAMGGKPTWAMLSLGVPERLWNTTLLDELYAGWFALAKEFDVELVGGDVSRVPDKLVIDSIVGGEVAKGKAIMRSGAKPGDLIYVTGSLGRAAGGLKLLEQDHTSQNPNISTDNLIRRQLEPTPQLTIANLLMRLDIVTSMIDISDGLSSDLFHICRQSGVGARIYADRLPIDDDLAIQFDADESLEMALNGGEDFELLFTSERDITSTHDMLNVTHIGEITAAKSTIQLNRDGKLSPLEPKGFRHF